MLALDASSDVLMSCSIRQHSQNANVSASSNVRKTRDAIQPLISHYANMEDEADKNGGPNHLKAWMKFRKITGAKLADKLGITPGMVSDLANSNRALSAKWLRRIAPALGTTPGMLLDHDPNELDNDIIDIWVNANSTERRQLIKMAKVIASTGTDG